MLRLKDIPAPIFVIFMSFRLTAKAGEHYFDVGEYAIRDQR